MDRDDAISMFFVGDILVHTWDLARAAGLDETLDADEVAAMYEGMEPLDEMLRASGQYNARVIVPDDADVQTKLIAFSGRQPSARRQPPRGRSVNRRSQLRSRRG